MPSCATEFSTRLMWYLLDQLPGKDYIVLQIYRLQRQTKRKIVGSSSMASTDEVIVDTESGEEVVAICTKFMQRVHEYCSNSKDIVFLDASGMVLTN